MTKISKIHWNSLSKSIQNKKCILFLGPGVTVNYNNPANRDVAYKKLITDKNKVGFHEKDKLLVFENNDYITDFRYDIKEIYSTDFSNPLLEKIAEIPFHLIISVTPDHSLSNIFKRKKYLFQHHYFSNTYDKKLKSPSDIPLIYNLFGDIEDENSLLFSHYNLFQYLEMIWANNSLPEIIRTFFNKNQTSNIIFLGFEFDKWYYQLILYLFKLNFNECQRYAIYQQNTDNELLTLYESNFRINFLGNNKQAMKQFVETLHSKFEQNELRQVKKEKEILRDWLKPQFVKFLNVAFSIDEWAVFCMCYFEKVYDNFVSGQTRIAQIALLIEYVQRNNQYAQLYELCKEHNPVQFKKFKPYYE